VVTFTGDGAARAVLLAKLIAAGYPVSEFAGDTQGLEEAYFARVGGGT
jgi:hypothetical protein